VEGKCLPGNLNLLLRSEILEVLVSEEKDFALSATESKFV
jgi:hypothetical protein